MMMKYLGLKLGPVLKLCNIVDKLRSSVVGGSGSGPGGSSSSSGRKWRHFNLIFFYTPAFISGYSFWAGCCCISHIVPPKFIWPDLCWVRGNTASINLFQFCDLVTLSYKSLLPQHKAAFSSWLFKLWFLFHTSFIPHTVLFLFYFIPSHPRPHFIH